MSGRDCVPIRLYGPEQAADRVRPVDGSLLQTITMVVTHFPMLGFGLLKIVHNSELLNHPEPSLNY